VKLVEVENNSKAPVGTFKGFNFDSQANGNEAQLLAASR
jgi:hypothetical protein